MEAKKLVQYCYAYADDRKGEDPAILDVGGLSSVTDYFMIVSGSSQPHLRAIANEIQEELKNKHEVCPHSVDGHMGTGWVVIDYHDVIVHVMTPQVRERYDLESLWGDAPRVKPRRPSGTGQRSRTTQKKSDPTK